TRWRAWASVWMARRPTATTRSAECRALSIAPCKPCAGRKNSKCQYRFNTLVAADTSGDLRAIYELLKPLGVARWSLFFFVSFGRGKVLRPVSPEEGEQLMGWIHDTSSTAPFTIATTEAPSYRRVALDRMRAEGMTGEQIQRNPASRGFRIRDGHGIVFV